MKLKTIVQGLGAAMLVLLLNVWPLLSSRHSAFYHNLLPIHSVIWGHVIDIVVFSLFLGVLFAFLERDENGLRTVLWAFLFAQLVPFLLGDLAAFRQTSLPHVWAQWLFWGSLVAALTLRWMRPASYKSSVHGMQFVLLMIGCGFIWTVPELVYFGLRTPPQDVERALQSNPSVAGAPAKQRIVWMLFDELSYNQAFDHRVAGLSMPAFDRFKSESISFSDLQPAGYTTERVIPSFFLGHLVENLVSNLDGKPRITLAGQKGWHDFDGNATIFADAKRLGWTTGVVGWYNPYCRILAGTLDSCFWRVGDGLYTGTSPDQTAWQNAVAPLKELVRNWWPDGQFPNVDKHAADLDAILPQAETLIRNQNIGFSFIHLSVPHPPGIYDRRTGAHRKPGTYLDNLALADQVLGQLMATIAATPLANKTTIIVCSDHSWRLPLWRPTPQWSKDEQMASHGYFDQRPVLMIHAPGEETEQDINAPVNVLQIHDIIERLLRDQPAVP